MFFVCTKYVHSGYTYKHEAKSDAKGDALRAYRRLSWRSALCGKSVP